MIIEDTTLKSYLEKDSFSYVTHNWGLCERLRDWKETHDEEDWYRFFGTDVYDTCTGCVDCEEYERCPLVVAYKSFLDGADSLFMDIQRVLAERCLVDMIGK